MGSRSPFRVSTEIFLNGDHKMSALIDSSGTDRSFISEKYPDSGAVGIIDALI